jgi:hypothetical protein
MLVENVPVVSTLTSIGGDAVLDDAVDREALAPAPIASSALADHVERHAEIEQRAEHHVAGGTRGAVDVKVQAFQFGAPRSPRDLDRGHRRADAVVDVDDRDAGRARASSAPSATRPSIETP